MAGFGLELRPVTPGRREFLTKYAALWAGRSEDRRRSGAPADSRIADTLDSIVVGMLGELAAEPPPPMVEHSDEITWKSPVFNVGGRLNPFAGTKREGWLASANACERLGYPDIAAAYFRMAADVDPAEMPDARCAEETADAPIAPRSSVRSAARPRSTWTGPPMPPPEPIPFTAAGQMDMFA